MLHESTFSPYYAKPVGEIDNGKKYLKHLRIGVFKNDEQIGEYQRNYGTFYNTFYPFKCNGVDLALYSSDYTATRLMSLPDCKDIGGEAPNSAGFCPTGYYVPQVSHSINRHIKDGPNEIKKGDTMSFFQTDNEYSAIEQWLKMLAERPDTTKWGWEHVDRNKDIEIGRAHV